MARLKTKQVRIDARLHKRAKIFASQRGMTIGLLAKVGLEEVILKLRGKPTHKLSPRKKK